MKLRALTLVFGLEVVGVLGMKLLASLQDYREHAERSVCKQVVRVRRTRLYLPRSDIGLSGSGTFNQFRRVLSELRQRLTLLLGTQRRRR